MELIKLQTAKRDKEQLIKEYKTAERLIEDGKAKGILDNCTGYIVTFRGSQYKLIGTIKKQHCYQAILQDIKQSNSEIVANVNDILLEG